MQLQAASSQVVPEAGSRPLQSQAKREQQRKTEDPASSGSLWKSLHELGNQLSALQTSYVDNFEAKLATKQLGKESGSKRANPLARLGALRARAARELAFALHTSEHSDGSLVAGRLLRKVIPPLHFDFRTCQRNRLSVLGRSKLKQTQVG